MKFRIIPAQCFNAASALNQALILLSAFVFTGCASVKYTSNSPVRSAKPAGYPIPIYMGGLKVPRPCEVIGTVSIGAGKLTMFGGSAEKEWKEVTQIAHEKGVDAIHLTSVEKPDFANSNYRLKVDLLRYSTAWDTIAISENEFQTYLQANQKNLDPIEGIWSCGGFVPHMIGIMKDKSKSERDFIGFILYTTNPAWRVGYKKIDIRRGREPGSYVFAYYLEDFAQRGTTIILKQNRAFALNIQTLEEQKTMVINYTKN